MKKTLAILLIFSICALFLVGCGSDNGTTTTQPTQNEQNPEQSQTQPKADSGSKLQPPALPEE